MHELESLRKKIDAIGDAATAATRRPTRRPKEIVDFGAPPTPAPIDVTGEFSPYLTADMNSHPTVIALVAAAREQASRPPYEASTTFKLHADRIRALLADVPSATRQALHQARARLAELDQALTGAEAAIERIRAVRPVELAKLDGWARESSAAGQKRDRLIELHQQAADDLHAARTALLNAMQGAAERRRAALATATQEARQEVQRAQAALLAAHNAEQAAEQLYARVRDCGLADQHIVAVLQEVS